MMQRKDRQWEVAKNSFYYFEAFYIFLFIVQQQQTAVGGTSELPRHFSPDLEHSILYSYGSFVIGDYIEVVG